MGDLMKILIIEDDLELREELKILLDNNGYHGVILQRLDNALEEIIKIAPDLILLDGGKGQVSAVQKVFDKYNIDIPLWGMYKDDRHRTKGLICATKEIELDRTSNLYRFVASIQEEVHNYAISYHRSLRNKSLTKSTLDDISGVGEKRKKALLSHFKNIEEIKNASIEELSEIDGLNKRVAQNIYDYFRKGE